MNPNRCLTTNFWILASFTVFLAICAGCSDRTPEKTIKNKPSGNSADFQSSSERLPTQIEHASVTQTNNKEHSIGGSGSRINNEKLLRTSEPIASCKAPSEYLFLKSKNVPDAVVVVTLPLDYSRKSSKTYPLVIAFGGAGECARPPREGAMAWLGYYKIDDAMRALTSNHLKPLDFKGLVTPQTLLEFNKKLQAHPFGGVIVACPYSPLIATLPDFQDPKYEDFILHELIPLLKRRYRVTPGAVGVDGVSMGGARAMLFGLKYPEVFSSIGSIQGAFGPFFDTYRSLIQKNRNKLKDRSIQLVTSDGDGMLPSVEKMRILLNDEGIPVTYKKLTGPHDYIFNQGPGSIALLMFHNRSDRKATGGPRK